MNDTVEPEIEHTDDAESDHVARLEDVDVELLKALINQDRIAKPGRRGGSRSFDGTPCRRPSPRRTRPRPGLPGVAVRAPVRGTGEDQGRHMGGDQVREYTDGRKTPI